MKIHKIIMIVGALCLAACHSTQKSTVTGTASAETTWPPFTCNDPCIITSDGGGEIDMYQAYARLLVTEHTKIIVDGPCMSACTVLVDIARDNVCITHGVLLGYHQSRMDDGNHTIIAPIDYSTPGLDEYIKAHGGEPDPTKGSLLMLNFEEAKQFYKPCQT